MQVAVISIVDVEADCVIVFRVKVRIKREIPHIVLGCMVRRNIITNCCWESFMLPHDRFMI